MYTFDKYIGQQVRRVVFAIKIEGRYYHLMSIWEHLEPDMSDINAFHNNDGSPYVKFIKSADANKKVFLFVDEVLLTKESCEKPWSDFYNGKDIILPVASQFAFKKLTQNGAEVIPMSANTLHPIVNILPHRSCSAYVSVFTPAEPIEQFGDWLKDPKVQKQLETLSLEYLGFNICEWGKYIGKYIFVSYNPIYRDIHWKVQEENLGIYCQILFRNGARQPLRINIEGYNDGDFKIFEENDVRTEEYESFISFHSHIAKSFKYLKAYIYDENGTLIDYEPHMNFVHQIDIDVAFCEKTLKLLDKTKKVIGTVDKYHHEQPLKIGTTTNSLLEDNEYAYQALENAMDFIYLDGDKDGSHVNRDKGITLIRRIINSAKEKCYICDVYFSVVDFEEFILETSSLDVDIRILSSKFGFNDKTTKEMYNHIKKYNEDIGGKVSCRLLVGDPILHDRLIIADDMVWMLGSSLNHFGAKATTLIRVPKLYREQLIAKVNNWWNNDSESKEL